MMDRLREVQQKWDATRDCPRCKGTGKRIPSQWELDHQAEYPLTIRGLVCSACRGEGLYPRPDLPSVLDEVLAVQKGKVNVRSARPKYANTIFIDRCYYVWRLARFHGGRDVTLPVIASSGLGDDPFRKELDALAETTAKLFFGTDMAAALRWGPLLGGCTDAEARAYRDKNPQPMTAEPCGPAVIVPKPPEEHPELF